MSGKDVETEPIRCNQGVLWLRGNFSAPFFPSCNPFYFQSKHSCSPEVFLLYNISENLNNRLTLPQDLVISRYFSKYGIKEQKRDTCGDNMRLFNSPETTPWSSSFLGSSWADIRERNHLCSLFSWDIYCLMPAVIQVWGNLIPLHSLIKCFTLHIKNLDQCI